MLATIHRAENTDIPYRLNKILDALSKIQCSIVFPIHPRTRSCIEAYGIELGRNIIPIEPVGYLDMLALEGGARKIITDSGGVQKEAFFLGTPCITVRDETEWIETVEDRWNIVAGCDENRILYAIESEQGKAVQKSPYGNGNAAEIICSFIEGYLR